MRAETRKCYFCGNSLSGNRAKEHVIRKAWLKELNLLTQPLEGSQGHKAQFVATRRVVANNMLAGEICQLCNNGWMNRLDEEVHELVIGLATLRITPLALSPTERALIGRWALKVACAFEATDSPDRRSIPEDVRRDISEGREPRGSYLLAVGVTAISHVGASILDVWSEDCVGIADLRARPQSCRLKFGISLGRVVFSGVCIFDASLAIIEINERWHVPLYAKMAGTQYNVLDPVALSKQLGWDQKKLQHGMLALLAINPVSISFSGSGQSSGASCE